MFTNSISAKNKHGNQERGKGIKNTFLPFEIAITSTFLRNGQAKISLCRGNYKYEYYGDNGAKLKSSKKLLLALGAFLKAQSLAH